ncbi:hypothetical protein GIB67_014817 [Kingdonia uniflora]|uniref:Uncharacterized protein n=1 Tax=Kingdonia uniflora TaxID=39325 RepID=A0A7J7LBS8_9MAGN|nr:hypothetical protein GIB67_014817 [Kingdonia uniflora]
MLQWVKCAHVTEVYQFHDMIDMLLGSGYKKGITLFGYGYDFRQSNRIDKTMDGLKIKLDTAFKASGGRKVNIISHSMGGLLVSCLLSLHQDVCNLSTIFRLCIKKAMTNGVIVFAQLVECPSIYEMLPNPTFNWRQQPQIQVWRSQSEGIETSAKLESYGPTESVILFEEALRHNEVPILKFHN